MELLTSNFVPSETHHKTFANRFHELLKKASCLNVAVGYISEKSLEDIVDHIHKSGGPTLNLAIGMHYFDKFTHSQFAAAKHAETFLSESNLGSVRLVKAFPFHGKLYSFQNESGELSSIIGSSNFNNILKHKPRLQYEVDLLVDRKDINQDIKNFIEDLLSKSPVLAECEEDISIKKSSGALEGIEAVNKLADRDFKELKDHLLQDESVEIPIAPYEKAKKSNINACFGKGRENTSTRIIQARPWYEVELIVPKAITAKGIYPKGVSFPVVTDDGYEFECKTSGDYSKNFRSKDDLKILGRWLKGRLEGANVLKFGDHVTEAVLKKYGRNTIGMTPIRSSKKWYLNFNPE